MKFLPLIIGVIVSVTLFTYVLYPMIDSYGEEPDQLDVIIIDGQSNAEYSASSGRVNASLIDLPNPEYKLLYYGQPTAANSWPGSDSNRIYNMNVGGYWQIGGLEPYLAYTYSERSHHNVLTINVARGAQSIQWLAPSGAGGEYAASVIEDALAQVQDYRLNFVGWIMLQGEQDKNMPVETYKAYFLELEEYYTTLGADNCYIASTREYYGGNACIAQNELANNYTSIHLATRISDTFTEANGLLVDGDPIHYSQLGRNAVATAIGNYIPISDGDSHNIINAIAPITVILIISGIVTFIVFKKSQYN